MKTDRENATLVLISKFIFWEIFAWRLENFRQNVWTFPWSRGRVRVRKWKCGPATQNKYMLRYSVLHQFVTWWASMHTFYVEFLTHLSFFVFFLCVSFLLIFLFFPLLLFFLFFFFVLLLSNSYVNFTHKHPPHHITSTLVRVRWMLGVRSQHCHS